MLCGSRSRDGGFETVSWGVSFQRELGYRTCVGGDQLPSRGGRIYGFGSGKLILSEKWKVDLRFYSPHEQSRSAHRFSRLRAQLATISIVGSMYPMRPSRSSLRVRQYI